MATFINTKSIEWKRSPVNTDIVGVTGTKLGGLLARLEKGTAMEPHTHAEEQLGFVIEGAVEWVVGPELTPHVTEAGAFYFFEANEMHGIRNTLEKAILLDMFAPPMQALKHLSVCMHR